MIQYIEPEAITFGEELGSGATSVVYKGFWGRKPIAIKKFNNPCKSILANRFKKELEILENVNHANIINIYGYCNKRTDTFIVCELMEGGTLYEYLILSKELEISWNNRINLITQIVNGMSYLHESHEIYHLDLKSLNVLLDRDRKIAKIADFGLAKLSLLTSTTINTTKTNCAHGTTRWLAPELTLCKEPTHKCDVWSFGAMLLEFSNRELPFYSFNDKMLFIMLQNEDATIPIRVKESTPKLIKDLVEKCLNRNPLDRPSFQELKLYLERNELNSSTTPVTSIYDTLNTSQSGRTTRNSTETSTSTRTPTSTAYDNLTRRHVNEFSNYDLLRNSTIKKENKTYELKSDFCLHKIIGQLRLDEPPSTPTRRSVLPPTPSLTPSTPPRRSVLPPSPSPTPSRNANKNEVDTGCTYSSRGSANGRTIYQGPRGGFYYYTAGGNKRYV